MQGFGERVGHKHLPLRQYLGASEDADLGDLTIDGVTYFEAASKGNMNVLTAFLLGGIDVNTTEADTSYTALHYAAMNGNVLMARVLLDDGANPDAEAVKKHSATPLMVALAAGKIDVVDTLLDSGADPAKRASHGEPAVFYGAGHPLALHTLLVKTKLDIQGLVNDSGETVLHLAARISGARNAVLYLCEQAKLDPHQRDHSGSTPLHHAARIDDVNIVKALLSKGASPTAANNAGQTPLTMPGCTCQPVMKQYSAEASNTAKEKLAAVDYSNYGNLRPGWWKDCAFTFFGPTTAVLVTCYFPTIIGLIGLAGATTFLGLVAKYALAHKDRNLSTAAYYSGGLVYGSVVLLWQVLPTVRQHHPNGEEIHVVWWVLTSLMFFNYIKAALADPGAVQSTVARRAEIYDSIAKHGEVAIKSEGYDVTSMVKKPLRAKHCTKTHATVNRFDHFCVWTGNAIGGGNHRPFLVFCLLQIFSQLLVAYCTYKTLFVYRPMERAVEPKGVIEWMTFIFDEHNTVTTFFLLIMNSLIFVFVITVGPPQVWYAMRNVTSNEVWFADRYKWMFLLGSRAYSMFDHGAWSNLVDFFWSGDLCREVYDVPPMNQHLSTKSRQFSAKAKSQKAAMNAPANNAGGGHGHSHGGGGGHGHSHGGGDHGHSHGGGDHGHSHGGDVPSAVVGHGGGVASPSDAIGQLQQQEMPADAQRDMAVVQGMLQEMIAGGEPQCPAEYTGVRREQMLHQARTMHQHYAQMQQMQQQMQAQQRASKTD